MTPPQERRDRPEVRPYFRTSVLPAPATVSVAIFAWNEEGALKSTFESLFKQSLFEDLKRRGESCEVICVANGCTDRTPEVADELLRKLVASHPQREAISVRVANIHERGKVNAWNQFVQVHSARSAKVLFMMDADILLHRKETMANMLATLETDSEANVAVDVPRKHIAQKQIVSPAERLSLGASRMTLSADGQLCGQLYSIRAEVARRMYLPKALPACEDGLIKSFVCTDFLAHEPRSRRIRVAPNAEHTFEAYTTPRAILKNQKRQIIGQTFIHVLIDRYLGGRPAAERNNVAALLKQKDEQDPTWLKRLIAEHVRNTRWCWRLYPDLVSNRFRRLSKLSPLQRLKCLPAALAGTCATMAASFLAYRSLKRGYTDYWPKAQRKGFEPSVAGPGAGVLERPVELSQTGGVK